MSVCSFNDNFDGFTDWYVREEAFHVQGAENLARFQSGILKRDHELIGRFQHVLGVDIWTNDIIQV